MKRMAVRSILLATLALSGSFMATVAHAEQAAAAATATGEALAAQVKQALDNDPELKALNLKVTAKKADITIEGTMTDDQQMVKAGTIAQDVPGVVNITNNMMMK
ncbi:BON domain-containing protein [Paludibacterium denitrificans]|uniref:BON domain-containing protein n=1 Tax=Paludibacterium denitrificans TaxID=2675226 RepID=A0A844GDW9_9NEIS|nr:BON domain-containing protein [Paludibacterium denitrificans]MTD33461.1 BON domain-containing protein [Paludibacterium denitrificans]HJV07929.1 BON domain-containing protein [Chromobacteriaceae bacterium]